MTNAWQFDISTTDGEPAGEITVDWATGRWGQKINMETGVISDLGVFIYNATLTDANGTQHSIVIQRSDVLRLRRQAAKREAQDAVTCHTCGAPVELDALDVQTGNDGPILTVFYCQKHLVAGTEQLKAAIRAEREREQREREGV